MSSTLNYPDFFIIGAAKSGTTALFRYLKQHPQVFMSSKKEPHFFSFDDISKHTNGPGDLIPQAVTDVNQYLNLFCNAPRGCILGEASTSYLYRSEAPVRIHQTNPNAKLLAILRNPVERAFSAYMHLVRDNRETASSFREALNKEPQRIRANWDPIWHYTKVGMYAEQLSRYYALFDPGQILIFLHEEFLVNPQQVIKKTFEFLGVDASIIVNTETKMNVSGIYKNPRSQRIIKRLFDSDNLLRTLSRKIIPERTRWWFTETIRQKNMIREQVSEEDRNYLKPVFYKDIINLQEILSTNLSSWL